MFYRNVGISRKSHQRAKKMSHQVEKEKRRERKDFLEKVRVEKQSREELAVQKKSTKDKKCCSILLRFTLPPNAGCCDIDIPVMLKSLPLLSFENVTASLLLSFIKSWTFTKSTANKGQAIKLKKGKSYEVVLGQENLISMAFFYN